ncbi:hypothetical protein [Companilactobacillus halodurans]|uniref:Uncharacterized protein n=1 Tax=Companilactobacillus halodurans TaxID=2584183 RepID=A0A5P0ZYA0_9LACO|nr:hypothetical protein [Companilactobacillus halodurans]MQS74816.1 hypothetical protein [Companilactobacillus halodurans]MQS97937.1 hypothetical protein [Companilactobacillus halodurans]
MSNWKKNWLLILPIIIFLTFLVTGFQSEIVLGSGKRTEIPKYYNKPSPDPVGGLLDGYFQGGFVTQPNSEYNVDIGSSITINTNSQPSNFVKWGPNYSVTHTWMEKSNLGWEPVKKNNSSAITVSPTKIGKIIYQLVDTYSVKRNFFGKIKIDKYSYYSNVVTVNVTDNLLDATSVKMNIDADYLYNTSSPIVTNTAVATASAEPKNNGALFYWKSSDESIAKVDENSGLIVANPNGKSGKVTIFCVALNTDLTRLFTQKTITVGGGLDDQDAKLDDKVTFAIHSPITNREALPENIKMIWFRITKDGRTIQLATQKNPFKYVIDKVTRDNVGDSYYAQLSLNGKVYKTNIAKLFVTVPYDPKVNIENTIDDISHSDSHNTNLTLKGVSNTDKLIYQFVLSNKGYQDFNGSTLTFSIPAFTGVDQIEIDGKKLSGDQYSIIADGKNQQITIDLGNFKMDEKHLIKLETTVSKDTKVTHFDSYPIFNGQQTEDNNNSFSVKGEALTIDPQVGKISTNFNNIKFENIFPSYKKTIVHRTSDSNSPNDVVQIDDSRQSKSPMKVYLMQVSKLTNSQGKPLNGKMMYYRAGLSPQSIDHQVLVDESNEDEALPSIKWDKNEGLLLNLSNGNQPSGVYQATLNWSIINSI